MLTLLFAGFTLGFFTGRSRSREPITLSISPALQSLPPQTHPAPQQKNDVTQNNVFPININTATKEEFMQLPGIGEVLALRVIRYREERGVFSSVAELKNVEGIGEKRLEQLLDLVTTGG